MPSIRRVHLFILFAVLSLADARLAYGDTRIASQLLSDGTESVVMHWGTKFAAPASTVQSIALGISASCGTVSVGHLETIFRPLEFVSDGVFPTATPIPGGFRFTGGSASLEAGKEYYILNGIAHGPCAIDISRTLSSDIAQNAQIYLIDRDGMWLAQDASAFDSSVRDIVYSVCSDADCTLQEVPETPDPVIIIPGILGSEQHNGEWVIDPILHTYDDLIATLDENGYTPEQDLFTFPYNWRKSNIETALLLKQKIDEVKTICSCGKVDLVAHSMGGLAARQYIQSPAYDHDVDQLIFLGTPHLGAPKAYLMWDGGEVSPANDFFDELLEKLLKHEALEEGYISLFNYIRTEPIESVRELLPTYNYILDGNSLRQYPDNYPRNSFLEDLNNNVAQLLNSGIEIHNIVGETDTPKTINGIQATNQTAYIPRWIHGYPEGFYDVFGDHGLILGSGDKTVPLPSASFVGVNLTSTSSIHSALPFITQPDVIRILTGQSPAIISQDYAGLDLANLLLIKMLSPADLLIVAPDGSKIGKDLNGQEVNQIPNAFYTGFTTDTEFITILNPLPGQYKVFSQGTGSGSYTVETAFISEATTTEASFTGNTAPGLLSEVDFELSMTSQLSAKTIITLESVLADLERLYALGWLKRNVYKELREDLKDAIYTKKGKRVFDKDDLRDILRDLKRRRGKGLTEQAYQILKADIEWLIGN
ncbi:MAG: hypothetical protein AAB798_01180 [Patescibacteria group bacterium]